VRVDDLLQVCTNRPADRWRVKPLQHFSWRAGILWFVFLWMLGIACVSGFANQPAESGTRKNESAPRAGGKRPVTIEDAIEMTRLADPYYVGGGSSNGRVAELSPDKTKFVVVLRKGHIDSNTNEYSLLLWRTQELFGSAKPEILLTLSSSSNRPAVQSVHWQKDSETLLFLGEHAGETQQLYSFNSRTRKLKRVTNSPTNVLSYGVGGTNLIAYTAEPLPNTVNSSWQRLGRPISTQLITDVLLGRPDEEWSDYVRVLLG
jgi:hypothetical protein